MSCISDLISSLPFWNKLSKDEKEYISNGSFLRRFEKGEFIHSSENECLGMLYIISDEIHTYLLSEDGRE